MRPGTTPDTICLPFVGKPVLLSCSMQRLAVIDLGTNTFHLLIAENHSGRYDILYRDRLAVKVGVGGINQGLITPEGAARALNAFRQFARELTLWKVNRVRAIATSAFRNARNGAEVAEAIRQETGIGIEIVPGEQEADYIARGVLQAVRVGARPALIVDIGGGSVEMIMASDQATLWKRSFEVGGQRLVELFQQHDPILPSEKEALFRHLDERLSDLLPAFDEFRPSVLVGSSGTFDTLSEMFCYREHRPYDGTQSETPLTLEGFHYFHRLFQQKNRSERMQMPGMIELRVDMIVVACCLIEWVLAKHSLFTEIRVSTFALKEGVLLEMLQPHTHETHPAPPHH
jgi:exopolyphosphatase/guanosine-5'-triphosphate,3'-diphosphate pyrophosphatase